MENITVNIQPAGGFCNIHCGYCDLQCRSNSICEFNFKAFEVALCDIAKLNPTMISFVLHGGEPLTADLSVLLRIVNLCEKYFGEKSRVQVQTNGVLLTDNIAQILFKKRCGFSVSLDPVLGNCRCDLETRGIVKKNISQLMVLGADVGIVSVAHAHNLTGYSAMLHELCDMGVSAWTINRVRSDLGGEFYITEMGYVQLLLSVMQEWIEKRLFRSIRILPILDLLTSRGRNHSCRYSSSPLKCRRFFVFDGMKLITHCEHLAKHKDVVDKKCIKCDDYDFCGGGCLGEVKEASFCEARRLLKKVLHGMMLICGG